AGRSRATMARDRHRRRRRQCGRGGAEPNRVARPFRARRQGTQPAIRAASRSELSYRRRASPLHAARAGAATAYCLALGAAALLLSAPLALCATALAIVLAGVAAGVGRELMRAAR